MAPTCAHSPWTLVSLKLCPLFLMLCRSCLMMTPSSLSSHSHDTFRAIHKLRFLPVIWKYELRMSYNIWLSKKMYKMYNLPHFPFRNLAVFYTCNRIASSITPNCSRPLQGDEAHHMATYRYAKKLAILARQDNIARFFRRSPDSSCPEWDQVMEGGIFLLWFLQFAENILCTDSSNCAK